MHTKRGAIFSSLSGQENVVSNYGEHIILYACFATPYIFKKSAKNNGANTQKKVRNGVYSYRLLLPLWGLYLGPLMTLMTYREPIDLCSRSLVLHHCHR